MPLASQVSLHLSFGDTPAYLGVHSTVGSFPKEALENSLCASHCSSLNVFPEKRMTVMMMFPVSSFQPHVVGTSPLPGYWELKSSMTHHYCLDSPQCYTTCSGLVCLHNTSLHSLGLGCHILSLYTGLLHHRFLSSLPTVPMVPSFHEQGSKWRYRYQC